MTLIRKQIAPSANTPTTLYTATSNCVLSSIAICNRGTVNETFSISQRALGVPVSNSSYIYSDVSLAGKDTFINTTGIVVLATDIIEVTSSGGNLTFHLWGEEQ